MLDIDDTDDTDDLVHGQQELALYNTHAGGTCFKPMHIFEAGSGKPILSLLRPGKRPSPRGSALLTRPAKKSSQDRPWRTTPLFVILVQTWNTDCATGI